VIATLPVLGGLAHADDDMEHMEHMHAHAAAGAAQESASKPYKLKFFTEAENRAVVEMSERIIPADSHSPGAKAAKANEYIDFIVSQSPQPTKQLWKDGLAAVETKSHEMFGKGIADASEEEQVKLLKEISKKEAGPQTTEEHFFRALKNMTIDGYYTTDIGVHQEMHYKGNTYLKQFPGCTHPEHMKA
ncbi:MAG: gluconate 2-dehydrogenase subunit 3 family protein, partial [Blastocatellia bacterium]